MDNLQLKAYLERNLAEVRGEFNAAIKAHDHVAVAGALGHLQGCVEMAIIELKYLAGGKRLSDEREAA